RRIKIYNRGEQIPIYVAGQRDGWFDSDDYIEFYGQALDTRFSSTNIYWLKTAGGRGRRMTIKHSLGAEGQTPASFLCETHHEEDRMYWMDIPDTGYMDDHWFFGDSLFAPCLVDFTIRLSDVAEATGAEQSGIIELALQGISHGFSGPDHHAYIYLNGHLVDDTTWDGNGEHVRQFDVPQSYFVEGDNTIIVQMPGDTGAEFDWVLANWFKVSYWRQFKAKENALKFSTEGRGRYSYKVSNFTENDIEVFDITDPERIGRFARPVITAEGGTYTVSFTDHLARNNSKDYLVLSSSAMKSPVRMVADEPSDLRSGQNQADYIVITHEDFYDGILPLAEHRAEQGLSVKVVKVQDIYDEFNHGIFSPEAIKSFLKYAYCEWQEPVPTYVLLVGDGTYDYQDNEDLGGKNYVPTYMVHSLDFGETGCDNWFVCLDGDEDILPDMFIGRLPVYTREQLDTTVDKIINYETSASGDWTRNVTLVADNLEGIFVTMSEGLMDYLPQEYQANKIYLDNYPDPADCRTAIIDAINEGTLMVNYTGHGSAGVWAHEKILRMSDIQLLTNTEKLPFIATMTCGNGYFVFPSGHFNCIAEELLYSPSGGALAILAPTGISYPEGSGWTDTFLRAYSSTAQL
ncbi:MAG: C25 family cysteine peptidase, partial [Planctomycetota bacterium]